MALGYEGLIKIDTYTALGTGSAVPRSRTRLESSSGFGGKIAAGTPGDYTKMGIGAPYNYDWTQYDGSLNFELDKAIFTGALKPWLFNRQTSKPVLFRSRHGNVQQYDAYWNSISISANESAACDGSVAFVALQPDPSAPYAWGDAYIGNKKGYNPLCPLGSDVPPPLNPAASRNQYPVPFWNTQVWVTPAGGSATKKNFITWNVTFSQDIVKFFGCTQSTVVVTDPGAQEPLYLAAGPMTVTFGGSYMETFVTKTDTSAFLGDILDEVDIYIDTVPIRLKRLELNTESDDVQTGNALVPLTVEYAAYGISITP